MSHGEHAFYTHKKSEVINEAKVSAIALKVLNEIYEFSPANATIPVAPSRNRYKGTYMKILPKGV